MWFERIKLFNTRQPIDEKSKKLSKDNKISVEFSKILKSCNIVTRMIPILLKQDVGGEKYLYMYAWCSDWESYEKNPTIPVLYIDAHYDVVHKKMIVPQRLGDDIVIASCFDNRASCNVLCNAIENKVFENRPFITYALFSDGEESGMIGITEWFERHRTAHIKEKFVVMDVSNNIYDDTKDNLGLGVYRFDGDPIEKQIESSPINFTQQPATHKETYPDNLCHTHAGLLYHKFKCDVSRMGMPIACLHYIQSYNPMYDNMHISHTAISLRDMNSYYLKLETFLKLF